MPIFHEKLYSKFRVYIMVILTSLACSFLPSARPTQLHLNIQVADPMNEAISGAEILFFYEDGLFVEFTDSHGFARISLPVSSELNGFILIEKDQYEIYRRKVNIVKSDAIEVRLKEKVDSESNVIFHIMDLQSKPISNATIQLSVEGYPYDQYTDSKGISIFTFDFPNDEILTEITVNSANYQTHFRTITLLPDETYHIRLNPQENNSEILVGISMQLSNDNTNQPVPEAQVSLQIRDVDLENQTDQNGYIHFIVPYTDNGLVTNITIKAQDLLSIERQPITLFYKNIEPIRLDPQTNAIIPTKVAATTPVSTNTPLPTFTSVPLPTDTHTPTSTATDIPTFTPTPTVTSTPTKTPTPSPSPTPVLLAEPRVFAHYFPWYDLNGWDDCNISDNDKPLTLYGSDDPQTIARHITEASNVGIDGFLLHWFSRGNRTDTNFKTLLSQSRGTPFQSTLVFSRHFQPDQPNQQQIIDALKYIKDTYGNDPNFLKENGKPVLFFVDMQRVPKANGMKPSNDTEAIEAWDYIRDIVDPNKQMLWIAEGLVSRYLSVFDGIYVFKITHADWPNDYRKNKRWSDRARAEGEKFWLGTISPGWDDTNAKCKPDIRVANTPHKVDRNNGGFYQDTFDEAMEGNPEWLLITSFNEWVEGTYIEPSIKYQGLYMEKTKEFTNIFKNK